MFGRRLSPVFVLSFVSMVSLGETVAQFPLVVDLMLGPSHVSFIFCLPFNIALALVTKPEQ